jgi:hypothetical protein
MVAGLKLQKLDKTEMDISKYQKRLGSLMYAMMGTHPKLTHPITILSQHSITPGPTHFTTLNCVFCYLRCKGNLTDLRRILHSSLAKGNPK